MRLTTKAVAAIKSGPARAVVWDDRLKGFGLRITPNGAKTWIVKVRVGQMQRMVTIGSTELYSVDEARERAGKLIAGARDGIDPRVARAEAMTVAGLCDAYMGAAHAGMVVTRFHRPKAQSTVAIDAGRIARHIKPLIGSLPAATLATADVQRMSDAIGQGKTAGVFKGRVRGKAVVRGGIGTATRVVELLGGIWNWGRKRGHVSGASPTADVDRYRGEAKDRRLSDSELQRLGAALAGRDNEPAACAVRLIALTGMRRDEVCKLRWDEIDGHTLRLAATKTGRSVRPIGQAALDVLTSIPRYADWVFPNRSATGAADLKSSIAAIFDAAGLTDARSHDLRRTFASMAADMGYGDATIAELLGHARRGVTERHYVRRSDPVLVAAANAVSATMRSAMSGDRNVVVPIAAANAVSLRAVC